MTHPIFENWEDYDKQKKEGEDVDFFNCQEQWEFQYLKNKVKRHFPNVPAKNIFDAIRLCCQTNTPPRKRKEFVFFVMKELGLRTTELP